MYYIMADYLAHHGIKGQKWGVRRFQNYDGTLTPAGRKRVGGNAEESTGQKTPKLRDLKKEQKQIANQFTEEYSRSTGKTRLTDAEKDVADNIARQMIISKYGDEAAKKLKRDDIAKGAAMVTTFLAVAAGTILAEIKLKDY